MGSLGGRLLKREGKGNYGRERSVRVHEEGGSGTPARMILLHVQFVFLLIRSIIVPFKSKLTVRCESRFST